ncbi:hypothetical protein Q3G72_010926 [Acer saccharum]|nr:hypothetical protein Q3G72_010926 [Acer saccharum]
MDGMGWHHGSSQVVLTHPSSSSSLRSNNQQLQEDHHQSFMDLSNHEDMLFNPIHQLLHKAHQSSHQLLMINPNPDQRPHEMMTAVAKSRDGAEAGWRDIPSCVSSMPLVGTCVDDHHDHFGLMKNNNGKAGGGGVTTTTCSLESLDCLLSASNSNNNTDTSVDHEDDDDGISMIFSDSRNHHLWNFGANNNISTTAAAVTVSSGESSENKLELEETLSQSSSDHHHQYFNNGGRIQEKRQRSINCPDQFHLLQTSNDHSSFTEGGFRLISENPSKPKKPRSDKRPSSSNINFQQPSNNNSLVSSSIEEPDPEAIAQMKEMIYRAAAFKPVNLGMEVVERPKRKNVRISSDPQTVAARQRRERISERIRVLQRLVPGGSKMDTASMLDEAANYLKFLRSQVKALENIGHKLDLDPPTIINNSYPTTTFSSLPFNYNYHTSTFPMQTHHHHHLQNPNNNPNPI